MTKQLQWAIGGLALLVVGFAALQIYLHVDMKQFKGEHSNPEPKTETETEQPPDQVQATDEVGESTGEFKRVKEFVGVSFALPPSSVPDDIPEELKLPPELNLDVYAGYQDPPEIENLEEKGKQFQALLQNIVQYQNKNRPMVDIWGKFIEYEKMYRVYAENDLRLTLNLGFGFGRPEWQYEQTWAFPEIMGQVLEADLHVPRGNENPLIATWQVEMGIMSPAWNKIILKDGRPFFVKGRTKYEFRYIGIDSKVTSGFSRTSDADAPLITIDVLNTSDEELKEFMGWDYSINPLTLEPIKYEVYISPYNLQ